MESYIYYTNATLRAPVTNLSTGLLRNQRTMEVLSLRPLPQNLTKLPVEGTLLLRGQGLVPSNAWLL